MSWADSAVVDTGPIPSEPAVAKLERRHHLRQMPPATTDAIVGPHLAAAIVKRTIDIVLALVLLLMLLPSLVLIALAVLVADGRPILFHQERVGRGGRIFRMVKFRTFPVDHVDDVHSRPLSDCPSGLGRTLRRTSLDELPQLWNVLRGDMSFVGPRPERPHFASRLGSEVPRYDDRHRMRGGITGLAQTNGYWGPTDIAERIRLDNEYIDNWSVRREIAIWVRTVPAVVRKLRG
jgi:lipopolysaccharide/colanic/teichoic acid biosynthesis glycosyltransferase